MNHSTYVICSLSLSAFARGLLQPNSTNLIHAWAAPNSAKSFKPEKKIARFGFISPASVQGGPPAVGFFRHPAHKFDTPGDT